MAKCPLAITVLAAADFLVSPFLLVAGAKTLFSTIRDWGSAPLLPGRELLLALDLCILAVGGICAVAAADLWRLRKRGRGVTIFLMCIFGAFAQVYAVLGFSGEASRVELWAGCASFAFCVWAVVYLCLPSVRRKFEASAGGEVKSTLVE